MCAHDLVPVRTHDSTTWSNSLSNHLLDHDARQEKMHRHHLLKDWGGQTIGWPWQGELPGGGDLVKLRICNGRPGWLVWVAQECLSQHSLSEVFAYLCDHLPAAATFRQDRNNIWTSREGSTQLLAKKPN